MKEPQVRQKPGALFKILEITKWSSSKLKWYLETSTWCNKETKTTFSENGYCMLIIVPVFMFFPHATILIHKSKFFPPEDYKFLSPSSSCLLAGHRVAVTGAPAGRSSRTAESTRLEPPRPKLEPTCRESRNPLPTEPGSVERRRPVRTWQH